MSDTRIKMFKKRPGPRIRPKSRVKEKEEWNKELQKIIEDIIHEQEELIKMLNGEY